MYGAILGDIIGSTYEFAGIKTKKFPLFPGGSDFTDDSILTMAVAKALVRSMEQKRVFGDVLVEELRIMGVEHPHPKGGYGTGYRKWLDDPFAMPYNSCGNGSAMRVSACGLIAVTLEEALALAEASAEVTHNHPEGIRGAQATAAAIFLAKTKHSREEIRDYIHNHFYPMDRTLDQIRENYKFEGTCQKSVPEAILAFLESTSFEDAICNTISLGGDADTMGAITGSIAWSFYRFQSQTGISARMAKLWIQAVKYLPEEWLDFIPAFDSLCRDREEQYRKTGQAEPFLLA